MVSFKVDFDARPWQSSLPGARFKVHRDGAKQLRLVEFTSEFVEPDWSEKCHVGLVVSGALEIDSRGRVVSYPEGAGIFIPAGRAGSHKARSVTAGTRLDLVVEISR